jgi:hypothetical protein
MVKRNFQHGEFYCLQQSMYLSKTRRSVLIEKKAGGEKVLEADSSP